MDTENIPPLAGLLPARELRGQKVAKPAGMQPELVDQVQSELND